MVRRVLITGLGSIGQRHARCLRQLYGDSVELHAYRSRGLKHVINDNLTIDANKSPTKHFDIIEHNDLDKALSVGMNAVFITNPPNLHIETALKAVKAGSNVFIEKPLSHSLDRINELILLVEKTKVVCMVGHQLRYHPITKRIKNIISNGEIGRITSAEFVFGEYLPGMHPYEDYRISHAAFEQRGGGSILSLNHDIDIACYLFGCPKRLFCLGGHYSNLEIDAEDTAHILMEMKMERNPIGVHILLDFIQRPTRREWIITGDSGSIRADLTKNTLNINTYNGKHKTIKENFSNFSRNDMFLSEIRDFFNSIENKKPSPLGLKEAYEILKVAIEAKKSLINGKTIKI